MLVKNNKLGRFVRAKQFDLRKLLQTAQFIRVVPTVKFLNQPQKLKQRRTKLWRNIQRQHVPMSIAWQTPRELSCVAALFFNSNFTQRTVGRLGFGPLPPKAVLNHPGVVEIGTQACQIHTFEATTTAKIHCKSSITRSYPDLLIPSGPCWQLLIILGCLSLCVAKET